MVSPVLLRVPSRSMPMWNSTLDRLIMNSKSNEYVSSLPVKRTSSYGEVSILWLSVDPTHALSSGRSTRVIPCISCASNVFCSPSQLMRNC